MALVWVKESCCLDFAGYNRSEDVGDKIDKILWWSEKGWVKEKRQEWHLVSFSTKAFAFVLWDGECWNKTRIFLDGSWAHKSIILDMFKHILKDLSLMRNTDKPTLTVKCRRCYKRYAVSVVAYTAGVTILSLGLLAKVPPDPGFQG